MENQFLVEAKKLHDIGAAPHWLHPMSKAPVEEGWSDNRRDTWETLKKKYRKGNGLGVKLGKPSRIGAGYDVGYLAVIDVDVKSTDKKHKQQAYAWIQKNLGKDFLDKFPITVSGRGGGSIHIWLSVDKPLPSRRLTASGDIVEVMMPSARPTQKQIEKLGQKKIDEGWRIRPAFEIDFMCEGKQVVLPPTIHPDSKKAYKYFRPLVSSGECMAPLLKSFEKQLEKISAGAGNKARNNTALKDMKVSLVEVPLKKLKKDLGDEIWGMLNKGTGVEDRSGACFSVAIAMVLKKYTDEEICWVLTNKDDFYLGTVAYEHAQTEWRERAAKWVMRYCIEKAREQYDARLMYSEDNEENTSVVLDEAGKKEQLKQIEEIKSVHWRDGLDLNDKGHTRPTLKNVITILSNVFDHKMFLYDEFAARMQFGVDALGVKAGTVVNDDHAVAIKAYMGHKWQMEPSVNTINEAINFMGVKNKFHPVREYISGLKWDGEKRIETWLKDFCEAEASEAYLCEVSKKFLVASVARIFKPGTKFDSMLILEGRQGVGKSTLGAILATQQWFLDSLPNLQDKDSAQNLRGMWLVEFGELASMKRAEVEVMKAFVSRQVDKFRPSYGVRLVESPRGCVFFGTTNEANYLQDKTGNRRFWPVRVGDIDLEGLKKVRDQLWAEAHWCFLNEDVKLWLQGDAKREAEQEQDSRLAITEYDLIEEKILAWMEKHEALAEENYTNFELRFMLKQLFDPHENVGGGAIINPLTELKASNYTFQLVASVLRKHGFVTRRNRGRTIFIKE